jgi:hypothetical protein
MKRTINSRIVLAMGLGLTLAALCLSLNPGSALSKAPAAELHVCPDGCPYSSVQAAVDAADEGDIIKVATGIYTDVSVRPCSTNVVTQVVYISKTVTIQGGYANILGGWTTSYPVTQPTILDAKKQGRVLYIIGDISPTIEGLNLTGGSAPVGANQCNGYVGGGVFAQSSALTLSHNYIYDNANANSGGGIALAEVGDALLTGNTVISNASSTVGGGIYARSVGQLVLDGNTIVSNTANLYNPPRMIMGGGVFIQWGEATIRNNRRYRSLI